MNKRQKSFVLEYLKDLNATQAAIRAGYSKKTAAAMGHENLRKPEIAAAIQKQMQERSETVKIDAAYVLSQLNSIASMSVRDILTEDLRLRPLSEWPESWCRYISAIDLQEIARAQTDQEATVHFIKKLKWPEKMKALELMGKHVDVQAFKERVDHLHEFSLEELVAGKKREAND